METLVRNYSKAFRMSFNQHVRRVSAKHLSILTMSSSVSSCTAPTCSLLSKCIPHSRQWPQSCSMTRETSALSQSSVMLCSQLPATSVADGSAQNMTQPSSAPIRRPTGSSSSTRLTYSQTSSGCRRHQSSLVLITKCSGVQFSQSATRSGLSIVRVTDGTASAPSKPPTKRLRADQPQHRPSIPTLSLDSTPILAQPLKYSVSLTHTSHPTVIPAPSVLPPFPRRQPMATSRIRQKIACTVSLLTEPCQ